MQTLLEEKKYAIKNKKMKLIKDPGKGKSYALNLILKKVRGDIIILSDGDVYVSETSIKEILAAFEDSAIGCVTGRPVPIEDRSTKYNYWANFLFDAVHRMRKKSAAKGKFIECSAYLWAFRNKIINEFPLDVAEDTIVPYFFWNKGYKIGYADKAEVYVKNSDNWKDWKKQKIRTSKAHERIGNYVDTKKTKRAKTFFNEAKGIFYLFSYPRNIKEFIWSLNLILARANIWFSVFKDIYIKRDFYQDAWERVESTKQK